MQLPNRGNPPATELPRASDFTLYRIEEELESLLDSLDICPDERRPELEQRIAQYLGAEKGKVDNIGRVLSSLDSVQLHAKLEIERLRARSQAAEKNARRLEAYILHVLAGRDGKPLKGDSCTLFARRTEALVITDPGAVPDEWKRKTITVDIPKDPIKRALKAGEDIPGVVLEQHESLVRR
jgi:hypothetical protein